MPEPITVVGVGAIAAYLGKDGIAKLLGPTADYLGDELQEFTKKRINNIGSIFKNAEKKLGDNIDEPGSIPPKVLKTIINDGSYSEDEIAIEYFGGILASSRSEHLRDDRGARVAKTLDNLSCYQLRFHYLVYSSIANIFKDQSKSLKNPDARMALEIFVPMMDFANSLGVSQEEWDNAQLIDHIFNGLSSDGLISTQWAYGSKSHLEKAAGIKVSGDGVLCAPSASGAELFLWGFGKGNDNLDVIFTEGFTSEIDGIVDVIPNAVSTRS